LASLTESNIVFIGGGVMAEAFIRGILARGLAGPERITVSEPLPPRREYLTANLGVRVIDDNAAAARLADIIVLAVKPQAAAAALAPLNGALSPSALVISIMAGVRLATIERLVGSPAIVRAMPNTPAQIGEGVSAWTSTAAVSELQTEQARALLSALGEEIQVANEDYVDMATALSGSGPAYVFLFIEALIDAGVQIGLPRPVAERMANQTVRGSALFAQRAGQHPAILRNMVTSPGGTTAAGLFALERGGLRAALTDAVLAAYQRAQTLGRDSSA